MMNTAAGTAPRAPAQNIPAVPRPAAQMMPVPSRPSSTGMMNTAVGTAALIPYRPSVMTGANTGSSPSPPVPSAIAGNSSAGRNVFNVLTSDAHYVLFNLWLT